MKLQVALLSILVCFFISCGTVTVDDLNRQIELYASRIAFAWENLDSFQMKGNARLQGSNLVARGPFVLWGNAEEGLLRGDFYGPDGKPVVSIKGDSTGMLIYFPQDEYATYMTGGLHIGGGAISVVDLIHLLRTGYPIMMEAWEITGSAFTAGEEIQWVFCVSDTVDRMVLTMKSGSLFPSKCIWKSGNFMIHSTSPHDEYNSWPWSWSTRINNSDVDIELTEINTTVIPSEGIWGMIVPIPIDTIDYIPPWRPEASIFIR